MKVLVIPDVHLKPWMFDKASKIMEDGRAENAVCLMDIADDFNMEFNTDLYKETYDKAIEFAKRYKDSLWCWGNHDLSYAWYLTETGYSWYAQTTVSKKLDELCEVLAEGERIKYVQRIDSVLFSHGGLGDAFVKRHVVAKKRGDVDAVLKKINSLDCMEMWNDLSPIWLRPQGKPGVKMYGEDRFFQVLGHTPVKKYEIERNFLSCDVFSTYRDGTPYGCQKFVIVNTKEETYEVI